MFNPKTNKKMNDKFINQRVIAREFIDICRDAYGGEIIRQLERTYILLGNESKRTY